MNKELNEKFSTLTWWYQEVWKPKHPKSKLNAQEAWERLLLFIPQTNKFEF